MDKLVLLLCKLAIKNHKRKWFVVAEFLYVQRFYATPFNFLIASVIFGTISNASPTIP